MSRWVSLPLADGREDARHSFTSLQENPKTTLYHLIRFVKLHLKVMAHEHVGIWDITDVGLSDYPTSWVSFR